MVYLWKKVKSENNPTTPLFTIGSMKKPFKECLMDYNDTAIGTFPDQMCDIADMLIKNGYLEVQDPLETNTLCGYTFGEIFLELMEGKLAN